MGEWPEGLYEAEMRVAAFQNGYYVALCNRVGREEKLTFAGESFVCGPDGTVIARPHKDATKSLRGRRFRAERGVARAAVVPAGPAA